MNSFQLTGKVVGEIEKSATASGIQMARMKIAVEKNKEEDNQFETYEVVMFRQLADVECKDGQLVAITGRLSANNYESEKKNYYNCNLIGNSIEIL